MAWTKADESSLLSLKSIIDNDDIRYKEKIKQIILNDKRIIHCLNNERLDEEEPDEYFGDNILPFYLINPAQVESKNFICFEVSYNKLTDNNIISKQLQIVFYILCEQKNLIYNKSGIARHDLLAALIIDDFNWTDYWGSKLALVSDVPSTVDVNYACRTLIFKTDTDNNIVKTRMGKSAIVNQMMYNG